MEIGILVPISKNDDGNAQEKDKGGHDNNKDLSSGVCRKGFVDSFIYVIEMIG